ncbi:MAG: tRNA (adenosine(37)-N6)-threonylcarbamoyltransferase complex dimerization subunit type 1 TsaB [Gammaproteobacteria bacterium]|jgi:tRNA threonylcarbamoyladenosine biosynthesis protein TsaB
MRDYHLLAIETATAACSAALYLDGEVRERYALAPRRHAALILPMVDSLLAEADLAVGRLDAIAFGRGPGSFTGVRIAASITQGIALAADLPVVAVSTLAALALGAMRTSGEHRILAVLDARMAEVYQGAYVQDAGTLVQLLGAEGVSAPQALTLPDETGWLGAGSGWASYESQLREVLGQHIRDVLPDLEPRAGDVARLGADRLGRGETLRPEQAVPVYLRNRVAREP